ncbi:tRNA lysidine(34) synthetase TilS [Nodosilinea sp. P-1105]|uniref:tRNA lysidine(34) synthetase TilS n=1 Tax=Nodosilinea sp. P-1105 TaxID=2546229 RepID=UPI00146BC7A3|nr:tRNA lysidine(34) synthetase TilS [Nodosilinea sp. P-1105]NMF83426.1 tRNA lysidine(34) synthetase TilS [Nodosilinea sp. P-1105]
MAQGAWSDIHATVHRQLKGRSPSQPSAALIPPGAVCLVAISGGQDSVCLLKLLVDLQPKWHWRLQAIHCDHRWRSDSADNVAFVVNLCHSWSIPIQVVTAPEPLHTEAEARQWRYQVFETAAIADQVTHVATGHTASDRAETMLYNLLRGSGSQGLQALAPQRSLSDQSPHIQVVRPILSLTRQQTITFCHQFDLPIWADTTNQNLSYTRNRIRLELMPYLQQHFNPQVETTLAQTAELLTAEVALLDQLAQTLYDQTVHAATDFPGWRIQRSPLQAAPLALQRRVVRQVLQQVVASEVSFNHGEKLVSLIYAPNRSQTDPFPGGWLARVDTDWIVLIRPPTANPGP